jgi:hypothetical protein
LKIKAVNPSRISLVYAASCPHCYPLSVEAAKKMSKELGIPLRLLDINDPKDVVIGDELVKRFGDNAEDYLIPQAFLEYPDGRARHILTGFSEDVSVTELHWNDLFQSKFYASLKG